MGRVGCMGSAGPVNHHEAEGGQRRIVPDILMGVGRERFNLFNGIANMGATSQGYRDLYKVS